MITPRKTARYGMVPDLRDSRDKYLATPTRTPTLPPFIDLTPKCPEVYDQGDIGSCTANAIGAAFEYERRKLGLPDFVPSRLFIYYNERAIEGTTASDSGAQIRDGIKVVASLGVCPEADWPYDVSQVFTKPSAAAYAAALKDRAVAYYRVVQDINHICNRLASGYPVILGIPVYQSFESAETIATGVVPMPGLNDPPIGGHAILLVGYNQGSQHFIFRNSWGTSFGKQGYGVIDFEYIRGLAQDLWTIQYVD